MDKQTLRTEVMQRRKHRTEQLHKQKQRGQLSDHMDYAVLRLWQMVCYMMQWQSPCDWQEVPIASYVSLKTEMPTFLWHDFVQRKGAVNVLPVARYKNAKGKKRALPLNFYPWRVGDALVPDDTKIPAPARDGITPVIPHVVIVPLVAFDSGGYRLGMGQGFYDRTLALLKRHNPDILAIGYAYDCQYVDCVPTESFDMPLDAVVTETQVYEFGV